MFGGEALSQRMRKNMSRLGGGGKDEVEDVFRP